MLEPYFRYIVAVQFQLWQLTVTKPLVMYNSHYIFLYDISDATVNMSAGEL